MGEDEQKNFKMVEEFFLSDLSVKNILINNAPEMKYAYNQDAEMEYADKLFETLEDIEYEFSKMLNVFFSNPEVKEFVQNSLEKYKQRLTNCSYRFDEMRKIYQECFSNMDERIVSETKEKLTGYSENNLIDVLKNCHSVNEILHVMHFYVMNNEDILQALPKMEEKKNNKGYPISLYGIEKNELAQEIFEEFPLEIDCGWTDIVSLGRNDKILMMVRDKGHALSFEIDTKGENAFVSYFIPKICDIDRVKQLKGMNKIDEISETATGSFEVQKEKLTGELSDFIDRVPGDECLDKNISCKFDEAYREMANKGWTYGKVAENLGVTYSNRVSDLKERIDALRYNLWIRTELEDSQVKELEQIAELYSVQSEKEIERNLYVKVQKTMQDARVEKYSQEKEEMENEKIGIFGRLTGKQKLQDERINQMKLKIQLAKTARTSGERGI